MRFISRHITPLVINSLGGEHTHKHTHKHTHTYTHTHTHTHTHTNTHTTHSALAKETNANRWVDIPGVVIINNLLRKLNDSAQMKRNVKKSATTLQKGHVKIIVTRMHTIV